MRARLGQTLLIMAGALPAVAGDEIIGAYAAEIRRLREASDPVDRAWAAVRLGHGLRVPGDPGAHPVLLDALHEAMLHDPDGAVQTMAAYALCLRRDARGATRLSEELVRLDAAGVRDYYSRVGLPISYMRRELAACTRPAGVR